MSDFKVHILGCGSALPTYEHYPSCQVVELRGKLYMLDCGEAAQRQFRIQRLNFQRLVCICISHLHGDHCFGLPGLLSTLGLLGRTGKLQIIGPIGLKEYMLPIQQFFLKDLPYELEFIEISHTEPAEIYTDRSITIHSVPLSHRMPTIGFVLKEKKAEYHLNKSSADFYQVPRVAYPSILRGEDYINAEGELIPNKHLTIKGEEAKSYAYFSDTSYNPKNCKYIEDITLLYHEATFLEETKSRAKQTGHSTAKEAGLMAKTARAKRLLIGHYSARYKHTKLFLEECQEIFPDTILADEGLTVEL